MIPTKAQVRVEAARLVSVFQASGATLVEADILQPAATLLDLYGEDIRARAYVTHDPVKGEMMLRPDFTVPVVEMHMASGLEAARYAYAGEVFRSQDEEDGRANEHVQVGFEMFGGEDPAEADAEVFTTHYRALSGIAVTAVTGDIGILMAAVQGLTTSEKRKAALMRHIWHPQRFRALLDRYSGKTAIPDYRKNLLALSDPFTQSGTLVGLRSQDEIATRIENLRQDMDVAPIKAAEIHLLDEVIALCAKAPLALEMLHDMAGEFSPIRSAVKRMEDRLDALRRHDFDVDQLEFEGSYGRTAMEYYDGFVFGLYGEVQTGQPAIATGGRYDTLTRVLGRGRSVPAVGGVIRPDLLLLARGQS
jgi:ATP phosphoribosyltransferase regulatory subunit